MDEETEVQGGYSYIVSKGQPFDFIWQPYLQPLSDDKANPFWMTSVPDQKFVSYIQELWGRV